MPTNQILPFATGGGANTLTPTAYAALTSLVSLGFQSGVAPSVQLNTVWRQSSFMAAVVAQMIADQSGDNVNDDGNLSVLEASLVKAIKAASGSTAAVGEIKMYPFSSPPANHLKANGALLSRATYPLLYAAAVASGNMAASDGVWTSGQFSPGDGSTTFRVPDLRGYHMRAFDDGRGVDGGRAIGTTQADATITHGHTLNDPTHNHSVNDGGHNHVVVDPSHAHNVPSGGTAGAGYSVLTNGNGGVQATQTAITGIYLQASLTGVSNNAAATGMSINNYTGAAETRVKNLAFLACIKYQ